MTRDSTGHEPRATCHKTMKKIPISVVIIARNEEKNLEPCLQSVHGWADEIIVVDDDSTDKTVEIAQKYADRVLHRKMDNEGTHRNWSYAQAKHDWVFSLDADETAEKELLEEISRTIADTKFYAFTIPRKNYIGEYWMKHGGQYPAAQLRLFLKDKLTYEEVEVHPRVFLEGGMDENRGFITDCNIVHKSYTSFEHFLAKLNSQTTLEAKKWVKTNRQMSFGRAVWRTMDRFPRFFLRKGGYKDGFIGFMMAFFASLYQVMSYAKYWEMKKKALKS